MAKRKFFINGSWVSFPRITDFRSLIVGKRYYVSDGFWSGVLIYCGHVHEPRKYTFTFGDSVDSWKTNINLVGYKSNLEVYEYDVKA